MSKPRYRARNGKILDTQTRQELSAAEIMALLNRMGEPVGWMTGESIDRLRHGGNASRGTVPVHKSQSSVAVYPVHVGEPGVQ